jgi:hypothetical protein
VLRAASSFFLPISASGSPGQQASGRMFDATTEAPPATNGVVIGQAVAFRCIETMWRLAGTTRDDRAILSRAPATNAYVVFEIVRIPASAGLHFYNTN